MRRNLIGAATAAALLCAGWSMADDAKSDKKPPTKEKISELMKAAHKGEKAPLTRVTAELKKETPDWKQMTNDAWTFVEVGGSLNAYAPHSYGWPRFYTDPADSLWVAAKAKDKKAATEALGNLKMSCAMCHNGGLKILEK